MMYARVLPERPATEAEARAALDALLATDALLAGRASNNLLRRADVATGLDVERLYLRANARLALSQKRRHSLLFREREHGALRAPSSASSSSASSSGSDAPSPGASEPDARYWLLLALRPAGVVAAGHAATAARIYADFPLNVEFERIFFGLPTGMLALLTALLVTLVCYLALLRRFQFRLFDVQ